MTETAVLVARYRHRIRQEVLRHGDGLGDPRAALAARTRELLRMRPGCRRPRSIAWSTPCSTTPSAPARWSR